eukprot:8858804-Pyramimonas_sp.AAC.1
MCQLSVAPPRDPPFCRLGKHTFEVVLEVLRWQLVALATGRRPTVRHDGTPFSTSNFIGDRERARKAAAHPMYRMK